MIQLVLTIPHMLIWSSQADNAMCAHGEKCYSFTFLVVSYNRVLVYNNPQVDENATSFRDRRHTKVASTKYRGLMHEQKDVGLDA